MNIKIYKYLEMGILYDIVIVPQYTRWYHLRTHHKKRGVSPAATSHLKPSPQSPYISIEKGWKKNTYNHPLTWDWRISLYKFIGFRVSNPSKSLLKLLLSPCLTKKKTTFFPGKVGGQISKISKQPIQNKGIQAQRKCLGSSRWCLFGLAGLATSHLLNHSPTSWTPLRNPSWKPSWKPWLIKKKA